MEIMERVKAMVLRIEAMVKERADELRKMEELIEQIKKEQGL